MFNSSIAPASKGRPFISSAFMANFGPTSLDKLYPSLQAQSQPRVEAQDSMRATSESRYRDAFDTACRSFDDQSRQEFVNLLRENLDESLKFLFAPLASIETKGLQLPTSDGLVTRMIPVHYQEPPIRTLIKEINSMQFYSVLSEIRAMFEEYPTDVVIPDPVADTQTPRQAQAAQQASNSGNVRNTVLHRMIGRLNPLLHRDQEPTSSTTAPTDCFSVHTDDDGFCHVGYFNHQGLLTSQNGEPAMVINTLQNESTLVAPFKNGLADGPGLYHHPDTHSLQANFIDGVANGSALYITQYWQYVLVGSVVNGAFQNYELIPQNPTNVAEKDPLQRAQGQPQVSTADITCEIGDYVDGTRAIRDPAHLANIPALPKKYRSPPLDSHGQAIGSRLVLQTASGAILGTKQKGHFRVTEFDIKNGKLFKHSWATPTMVSARLPRAPAEMSAKKGAVADAAGKSDTPGLKGKL